MTQAILFDVETTGLDEPDVIQLAFTRPLADPGEIAEPDLQYAQVMFQPTKAISLGAMNTHHIIPEDLVGYPIWPGRWAPPEGVEYVVAHNCDFDWKAIGSPDVKRIDTLALSRATWPDLDSHKLGALVYYLCLKDVAREKLLRAHAAIVDVQLLHFLLGEILKFIPGMMSWHQLWLASEKARVPLYMGFGKVGPNSDYAKRNGHPMKCAEVRRLDPGYFRWLMNSCDQVKDDPYLRSALTGEPV